MNTLGKWAAVVALGLAVLWAGWSLNERYIETRIEKAQATQQVLVEKGNSEVKDKVNLTKEQLDKALAAQRKQYEKTVDAAISQYVADVAGLSNRTSRNSDSQTSSTENAGNTKGKTGATGAELSREDAEFLTGFARDTEELKLGLIQCYDEYAINKFALDRFLDDLEPLDELK